MVLPERARSTTVFAGSLHFTIDHVRRKMKGKDLICWRKPGAPCHADVLLAVANG
jgi:hypothetical protein